MDSDGRKEGMQDLTAHWAGVKALAEKRENEECHVCGGSIGVRKPLVDVPPTCPRNECMLAAAGMITVAEGRRRLAKRHVGTRRVRLPAEA